MQTPPSHPHLWLSLARYSANIRTAWSSGAEEGLISSRTTPYFLCSQEKHAVSWTCSPLWGSHLSPQEHESFWGL